MNQEYSYGAVIYKKENELFYLIEHMTLGHYSLPKGHIEKGESPEECAIREIKEELGLDVNLDTSFSHTITYSPKPGVIKDVTFYLATVKDGNLVTQKEEVLEAMYLNYEEALKILTYDSDKETLRACNSFLQRKLKYRNLI